VLGVGFRPLEIEALGGGALAAGLEQLGSQVGGDVMGAGSSGRQARAPRALQRRRGLVGRGPGRTASTSRAPTSATISVATAS
jgi:hypothetical protein